jgi:hypothetical protein
MPWLELAEKDGQLFKHHKMEASFDVPLGVPAWILNAFRGMIQDPNGCSLAFTIHRYHAGDTLTVEQWVGQWFQLSCYPHFSYMPYTNDSHDDKIDYARFAFVKDYGLQP